MYISFTASVAYKYHTFFQDLGQVLYIITLSGKNFNVKKFFVFVLDV